MTQRPSLRHVVFFSAKDKADIPKIKAGLDLLAGVPDADAFEVRQNSRQDALSSQVDLIVYAEFADDAALAAYKAHPLYQQSIDIVRPLRDIRIAADF